MRTERIDSGLPVLLVRPEDAARMLGVGRTKVYELMHSGALRSGCGSAVCAGFRWLLWMSTSLGWKWRQREQPTSER